MKKYKLTFLFIIIFNLMNFHLQAKDNKYLINVEYPDFGNISILSYAKFKNNSLYIYSSPQADIKIFGTFKGILSKLYTKDFSGSLFKIKCSIKGDSLYGKVNIIGEKLLFKGVKDKDNSIKGGLYSLCNDKIASLNAKPYNNSNVIRDYNAIINKIINISEKNIYNKNVLNSNEWKVFKTKITKLSSKIRDDFELIIAFYFFKDNLPFSHFGLVRKNFNIIEDDASFDLSEISKSTAYLKINSFSGKSYEVDSIFNQILNKNYKNLIVDLRDNPGGSIEAGLTFTSYLIKKPMIGGFFITQKWFNKNKQLPSTNDIKKFPIISKADYKLLLNEIHKYKGVVLKAEPKKRTYQGNVYFLINKNTASTCEPIVYAAKYYHFAHVIGEKTAGCMLSSEKFELIDGFKLLIPTADYYTIDGYRIEGNGVEPDIKVEDDKALDYVLKNLIK